MSYKLGSIANLISGTSTAEKGKIITNNFEIQCVEKNQQKVNETLENTNNPNVNKNIEEPTQDTLNDQVKQQDFKEISVEIQNTKRISGTKRGGKRNGEDAELSDSDNDKSRKRKKTTDDKTSQINNDPEICERTIFVGNWPLTRYDRGKIVSFFGKYGKISKVRFRGIPVGDTRIPKKVAAITKNFHEQRTSLNAYIRFTNKDSAVEALKANATVVDDHHIRVSISDEKPDTDQSKSIFVGNLPFVVEEDELWKAFSICGNIKCVRIIRDSETNASKGFAYVNFESLDGVELALQMKDVKIHNRVVRIKRSQIQKSKVGKKRDANGNKIRKNRQTEKPINRKNSIGQNLSTKQANQAYNFQGRKNNSDGQNFPTQRFNRENKSRGNLNNSDGQNFPTQRVNQGNNFRGNRNNSDGQNFPTQRVNQGNNFRGNRNNNDGQNFPTQRVNQGNNFRGNRNNSDGQNFPTQRVKQENNFRGVVAEQKKKKKFNKNEYQKKKMIRQILPHKNDNTP